MSKYVKVRDRQRRCCYADSSGQCEETTGLYPGHFAGLKHGTYLCHVHYELTYMRKWRSDSDNRVSERLRDDDV